MSLTVLTEHIHQESGQIVIKIHLYGSVVLCKGQFWQKLQVHCITFMSMGA